MLRPGDRKPVPERLRRETMDGLQLHSIQQVRPVAGQAAEGVAVIVTIGWNVGISNVSLFLLLWPPALLANRILPRRVHRLLGGDGSAAATVSLSIP